MFVDRLLAPSSEEDDREHEPPAASVLMELAILREC